MKKQAKGLCIAGMILIGAAVLIISVIYFKGRSGETSFFENKEFEGVFCTMGSNPDFSEEDFLAYRGLRIVKAERKLESFEQINEMMDEVFTYNPGVNTVYMEINPWILWENVSSSEKTWKDSMERYLLEIMRRQSGTVFEILLSYPALTRLAELNEEQLNEYIQVHQSFVNFFAEMDNVLISYVGAEQWLNANQDNYIDTYKLNAEVESHVFLAVFCDRSYLVDSGSMENCLENLRLQIAEYDEKVSEYPDFSEWSFVFFGDSIIGIDRSTRAIPGVVGALSGATVYNCGMNGASASLSENDIPSFLDTVDYLVNAKKEKMTDEALQANIDLFANSDYQEDKLCFFINFGLNDYFQGCLTDNVQDPYDPESYAGALRMGITQLKEAYPHAEVVVLVPTYIRTYEEGTLVQGENGQQLTAYREASKKVAEELEVHYKDNYQDMLINGSNQKEYLSDECHLNEKGRFLFGEQLVYFLEENVIK